MEMKSKTEKEYKVVGHVEPETALYTAKDLKKGQPYEFRVRAKNVVGVSHDAAELESPVVAQAKVTASKL